MIDDKKMGQRLKGVAMFFFVQPIISFANSKGFESAITLGLTMALAIVWWILAFGLYQRKQWARIGGAVLCFIQTAGSVITAIVFPSYLQAQLPGSNLSTIILITEIMFGILTIAYFLTGFWLLNKNTKAYFAGSAS